MIAAGCVWIDTKLEISIKRTYCTIVTKLYNMYKTYKLYKMLRIVHNEKEKHFLEAPSDARTSQRLKKCCNLTCSLFISLQTSSQPGSMQKKDGVGWGPDHRGIPGAIGLPGEMRGPAPQWLR